MKTLIAIFGIFMMIPGSNPPQEEIDSAEDEKLVKEAVVAWADSVFYMHKEYKFEHFKPFYTDEYFIQVMRANMYKKRMEDLSKRKENGTYNKSDDDYQKELGELKTSYENAQKEADNFSPRASSYRIHFWSNIMTNDGITVYYEHIMKLDNNYKIVEAVENSSIGKKSSATKIVYKKDVKG